MAMEKLTRLTAEQRDDLVAYLDGELDEKTSQDLEKALVNSAVARREIEMYSRTWDMLNLLPQAKASAEFTHKTMATLRVSDLQSPLLDRNASWRGNVRRGVAVIAWVVGLAACACLGFMATSQWVPNESDKLVDEYPVIENFEKYNAVRSVDFLRELRKSRTFHASPPDSKH